MPESSSGNPESQALKTRIIEALKTVHDPEIPVNIYELGLVYDIKLDEAGMVHIQMTLTSPACPVAGALPAEVERKVREQQGVSDVRVELVWDPPWTPARMSPAARLQLNMDLDTPPPQDPANKFHKLGRIP